jgi:hypothetical protein
MLNTKAQPVVRLVRGEDAATVTIGSAEESYFTSIGFAPESEAEVDEAENMSGADETKPAQDHPAASSVPPVKRSPGRPRKAK